MEGAADKEEGKKEKAQTASKASETLTATKEKTAGTV